MNHDREVYLALFDGSTVFGIRGVVDDSWKHIQFRCPVGTQQRSLTSIRTRSRDSRERETAEALQLSTQCPKTRLSKGYNRRAASALTTGTSPADQHLRFPRSSSHSATRVRAMQST